MKNKMLSKKYYLGINRVLIIYLLDAILYLGYNNIYNGESFSIKHIIKSILSFEIGYSWYVEMYIGLFLLIPFINLIYNNLKTKKEKQILILTMLILTSFQGIFNIKYSLIPDWWTNIYPLTYYFIGCYLNEYKINIKAYKNILLFLACLTISSVINIYISKENIFVWGIYNDWCSILNLLTSSLVFIFIVNLDLQKLNIKIKRIILKISELSFGMYLASWLADNYIYINVFPRLAFCSIKNYIIAVPLIIILSISLSMIINLIYKTIDKYIISKIRDRI